MADPEHSAARFMPATDSLALALVVLVSGLVSLALGPLLGLAGPAGLDADLWVLSAWNAEVGAPTVVTPAFPALLAAVSDGPSVTSAARLSALLAVLLPPATFLLARQLGARRGPAMLGALLLLLVPQVGGLAVTIQPDGLLALGLLASVGAALWVLRRPSTAAFLALALLAAGLPLVREHGLVVAPLLIAVAGLAPGTPADRAVRVLALAAAVIVGPMALGLPAGLPWEQAWFDRVGGASVLELAHTDRPPPELTEALRARLARGGPGAFVALAANDISRAIVPWLWVLLGFIVIALPAPGTGWLRRFTPLIGLLPTLPTLLVWSQPRHVAVAVPVAIATIAAGFSGEGKDLTHRVLRGLAGLALVASLVGWVEARALLDAQAQDIVDVQRFGDALCEKARPGDLAAGEPRAVLGCPLPRNEVGDTPGAGDWRTWLITEEQPPPGWVSVPVGNHRWRVYRLPDPPGGRPCQDSAPHPSTPYLAQDPKPVQMIPHCGVDSQGGPKGPPPAGGAPVPGGPPPPGGDPGPGGAPAPAGPSPHVGSPMPGGPPPMGEDRR